MQFDGGSIEPVAPELDSTVVIDGENSSVTLKFPDNRDHILRTIRQTETFYESELLKASTLFLKRGDIVIDVGANVGNHAIFWATSVECQVFAFEPVSQIFDCLVQNIVANELETRIFPNRMGLGSEARNASVDSYDAKNSGASRLSGQGDVGTIPVNTLDALKFLTSQSIRLLKVDVEGMELDVIRGAKNLIRRDRPIIICECPTDSEFEEVRSLLRTLDYMPIECFNATATYLFVSNEEFHNKGTSFQSFMLSSVLRNSRSNHELRESLAKQRRMLSALNEKINDKFD